MFQIYTCKDFVVDAHVVAEFFDAPESTIPEIMVSPKKKRLSAMGTIMKVSAWETFFCKVVIKILLACLLCLLCFYRVMK